MSALTFLKRSKYKYWNLIVLHYGGLFYNGMKIKFLIGMLEHSLFLQMLVFHNVICIM